MKTEKRWDEEWVHRQVADDISMRDFFSGRQYICRYFPWWGRALEAGCGLGRYVFYFSALGREILGVDFSSESISKARSFAVQNDFDPSRFVTGNIEALQFQSGSFSYYISLGVLEHFCDGPQEALAEAFRLLEPGGIILVTVPNNFSLEVTKAYAKYLLKSIWRGRRGVMSMFSTDASGAFFQYWYSRNQIAGFISSAGFDILEEATIDLRYPIFQRQTVSAAWRHVWNHQWLIDWLERTPFRFFGGNSVVVGVKPAEKMRCFICGCLRQREELKCAAKIPVCDVCRDQFARIVGAYSHRTTGVYPRGDGNPVTGACAYCCSPVVPHVLFGHFGFDRKICPACIRKPHILGELFSRCVRLTWKPYNTEK